MKKFLVVALSVLITFPMFAVNLAIEETVTISWQGKPGKFYQVLATTNLSSPIWEVIEVTVLGETNILQRTYGKKGSQRFFKVEETTKPSLSERLLFKRDYTNASLPQVSFAKSDIIMCSFENSTLNEGNFGGATIDFVDFSGADLTNGFFENSPYLSASFTGTHLWGASFANSWLFVCDFRGGQFNPDRPAFANATLTFCDFIGATGFNPSGGTFIMCLMPDGTLRSD
ncbi:MAG: pentapeptide repeat-containing protein [Patescibacteria group bacterium]